jgi:LysM repeat protein
MKLLLIVLFSVPLFAKAQNKSIVVEGELPNLFITHKVAAKENYYSIGRIYNLSPKEVAPFNNLVLENGLSLGQSLKIPLVATNFLQTGNAADGEVLVPLYHIVEGKEGLFRISTHFNKLPIEKLKKWNNIKGDGVASGTKLIVGYLKVKKDLSSLANMAKEKPFEIETSQVETPVKPVVVAKVPVTVKQEEAPIRPIFVVVSKEPSQPVASVKKAEVVNLPVAEKIINETVVASPAKEVAPVVEVPAVAVGRKDFSGGVFKSDFDEQGRGGALTSEIGVAGLFKSTSGWNDGKYYCLHNGSTPGTIVKITNTASGKSVYAKVLDQIPDIKQNTGLLVRISNAAADELGVGEAKFDCSLSYSK